MGGTPEWLYGVSRAYWGYFLRGGFTNPNLPPAPPLNPLPPHLGWGEHPREWTRVNTLVSDWGLYPRPGILPSVTIPSVTVYGRTRRRSIRGLWIGAPLDAPLAHRTGTVRSCGRRLPLGLPLGLQLGVGLSLSLPFLPCLGLRGFGWRGPWALAGFPSLAWLAGIRLPGCGDCLAGLAGFPWAFGVRGFGCLAGLRGWLPSENGPKTFLKKSLARCGMFVPINTQRGEHRRAKQTNERNEMNTAELSTAELLAAEEQAFTAKRAAWASVIFARTEEEIDRATSAYQQATVAYSQAHTAWYESARAANLLR